jgi:hypothetical protein
MLDVPRDLIWFVSGLLAAAPPDRRRNRRLGCYRQALFALAWFRDKGVSAARPRRRAAAVRRAGTWTGHPGAGPAPGCRSNWSEPWRGCRT